MKRLPLLLLPLLLAIAPDRVRAEGTARPQQMSVLPSAPDTGTPQGNPTPGTTRPVASCRPSDRPLAALVSNRGEDYTASQRPTFYFFVPYGREDIKRLEFVLLDGRERETVYRHTVEVASAAPGIVKVSLPATAALEPEKLYRWYLSLDCNPDTSEEPDLMVNGWVRHHTAIATESPSYDAIAAAMERVLAAPNTASASQEWDALVAEIGLGEALQGVIAEFDLGSIQ